MASPVPKSQSPMTRLKKVAARGLNVVGECALQIVVGTDRAGLNNCANSLIILDDLSVNHLKNFGEGVHYGKNV
jgi:hypothetical protein